MVHPVQVGKRTRMSFAKVKDVTEMPNLIEVQLDSYEWFLREGLLEVFDDVNPISNFTGNLVLEFVDYKLDMEILSIQWRSVRKEIVLMQHH